MAAVISSYPVGATVQMAVGRKLQRTPPLCCGLTRTLHPQTIVAACTLYSGLATSTTLELQQIETVRLLGRTA
jgi:hypothetical protein